MKKIIKNICSVFLVVALIGIIISLMSSVLERKESVYRYADFINEENEIDVIFLGSSHVRNAIYPLEMWNEYGIVSYNLAENGDTIPISYWKLEMILQEKTPKMVVIDVFNMWQGEKMGENGINYLHDSLDPFPLSATKIKAAYDLVENDQDRSGLFFKFSKYHSRWNEITENDFHPVETIAYKGASLCNGRVDRDLLKMDSSFEGLVYDESSKEYLVKMIELCQSKDIEVLLINTGYDAGVESQYFVSKMPELADMYGVAYIDLTELELIDYKTDLFTTGSNTNLNISGARKVTSYMGEVLSSQYEMKDHRMDSQYQNWTQEYEEYRVDRMYKMYAYPTLTELLLATTDKDFSVIVYLRDSAAILQEPGLNDMIANTSLYTKVSPLDAETLGGDDYLLVVDNVSKQSWEYFGAQTEEVMTSFGNIEYVPNEAGKHSLYINDSQDYLDHLGLYPEVIIVVVDNKSGGLCAITRWSLGIRI